jgi:serine protease Do
MRRAGDNVNLTIWRDGKRITKTVKLKARDESDELAAEAGRPDSPSKKGSSEDDNAPVKFDELGFTVEALTGAQRKELDVQSGVVVSKVTPYSEAAKIGLRPGAVILKADKQTIQSVGQFRDIIAAKRGKALLLQIKDGTVTRIVGLEVPKKDG